MTLHHDVHELERRLRHVLYAFAVLWLGGLIYAVAFGDAAGLTLVHESVWAQAHRAFLRSFTDLGLYPFYILFLGLYLYGRARRAPVFKLYAEAYLLAQLLGSFLIVRLLKIGVGRARPDATPLAHYASHWQPFSLDGAHNSFPSGHTADIVTGALVAAVAFRDVRLAAACLALAVALGVSRLAVAKHYPSDALAGAAIALAVTTGVVWYWLRPRMARLAAPTEARANVGVGATRAGDIEDRETVSK